VESGQNQLLEGHTADVNFVSFNRDGDRVLTASADRWAKIWDLDGNEITSVLHDSFMTYATFGEHDWFATVGTDRKVKVWRAGADQVLAELPHAGEVLQAAFSGDRLLTISQDKSPWGGVTATKRVQAHVWGLMPPDELGNLRLYSEFVANQVLKGGRLDVLPQDDLQQRRVELGKQSLVWMEK
jgi:WD40 repeat protein